MSEYKDLLSSLREPTRSLKAAIPEAWDGFAALHGHAVADGALPAKVKELTAVAIAVATGCDGCIGYHVKAAVRKGATAAEMAEMLAVALLMAGGPASVYAPKAWAAFEEFSGPRLHAAGGNGRPETGLAVTGGG